MKIVDGWHVPGLPDSPDPVAEQSRDVGVIDRAIEYIVNRRVCIQAGARVGLWPHVLATLFDHVIAFEPESENYECCRLNLAGNPKIDLKRAALGNRPGMAALIPSPRSDGLHHVCPPRVVPGAHQQVPMLRIDALELDHCDALFLDVEGVERQVLEGALFTLKQHRPVIVAEENILCRRYGYDQGDLEVFLRHYGYQLVEAYGDIKPTPRNPFPGADLIFVPT